MKKSIKKRELNKDEEILIETNRLREVFSGLDDSHMKLVENLIQNCAFMAVKLRELQKCINESPFVEEWTNGENQGGQRTNTFVVIYNTTIKNYNTCIKTLDGMLGKNSNSTKNESGLTDFMLRKK